MTSFDYLTVRRHLHSHPELSNAEFETHKYITEMLTSWGLKPETVAQTGVKVTIGSTTGPAIGYRADIDALPIQEANRCAYASKNQGVMHACGHDVHTTVGLGVAHALAQNPPENGSVTIIFQPAEEATPEDEPVGAEKMVQEGVLENPKLDAIFALHCMPAIEVGKIGHTNGSVWAESTLVEITVHGKSSHAAYPFEGVDAVVVAAQIITALQTVPSRYIDARDSIVLTIGSLQAGTAYNIIAGSAKLTGTMRTLGTQTTIDAKERITKLAESIAAGFGASADVKFTDGARLTANDLDLEMKAVQILKEYAEQGTDHAANINKINDLEDDEAPLHLIVERHKPQMASEDFAAFSSRIPGCYLFLGIRNEAKGITSALHTSTFDVDERCIPLAIDAMTHLLKKMTNG